MGAGTRRRWRIGIAVQLDAVVVLVVLALGGALGFYFVHAQREASQDALTSRIRVLGEYLSSAAEGAWDREDLAELDGILLGTALDPEVAYVLVKSARGEIRAGRWVATTRGGVSERAFPIHAVPPAGAATSGRFGPAADRDTPAVGTVAIGVDLAPLERAHSTLVVRTIAVLAAAAAAAAALGHLLARALARGTFGPLLAGIRTFAAGDLSHRMRLDARTAEVHEMGRAFDDMAERLSETLVTKGALESTVEARTAELTRALEAGVRMQEALASRELRNRELLDSTAEAITGVDLTGTCMFANPAAARILGFGGAEELVGRPLHELAHHSLPDGAPLPAEQCAIRRALAEGRTYHSAGETFWRSDRRPFPVEVWSHPIWRNGALLGAVVTFLDVSERRKLEAELLNVKKLESLGVLAGGIAHDFNNLLAGILGNLSVVREQLEPGGEPAQLVEEAKEAARRARGLTQQLLTFSKGGEPVRKVLAPGKVVQEAMTFALRGSSARGSLSVADGIWNVDADAGQLGQVVQNLVLNGAQAMPQGGSIAVTCDNVELPPESGVPLPAGRYVRISVADEGTGIAPELLPRIFDPYFTTKQTGSGLGLATVYAIVKKHGGHVAVRSRLGVGTTFDVWLPATTRETAAPVAVRAGVAAAGGGRVLVMDDEPVVRTAAAGMLAQLGYEAVVAPDGLEAVRLLEEERRAGRRFSAAVLDLTVPGGMGGIETLARLRDLDPALRAVASSGYSTDPVMATPGRFGFAAVLPKPYTLEELARAMSDAARAEDGGGAGVARQAAGAAED